MTATNGAPATSSHAWRNTLLAMLLVLLGSGGCILGTALLSGVTEAAVDSLQKADRASALCDLLTLESAVQIYAIEHEGRFPSSLTELHAEYLARGVIPLDPWGRSYEYEPPAADSLQMRIYSAGSDGQIGGSGTAADIDLEEAHRMRSEASR